MHSVSNDRSMSQLILKNHSFSGIEIQQAPRALNTTNRQTNTLFNKSLSNIKNQISNMQHTLQSLQHEFEETNPKKITFKDNFFRSKIQRRISDKERSCIKGSMQFSPQQNNIQQRAFHSPKIYHSSGFFDLIKQQLRQVHQLSPTQLQEEAPPLSQRRQAVKNHYLNNIKLYGSESQQNIQLQLPTPTVPKSTQSLQNLKDQISMLQNTLRISNQNRMMATKATERPNSNDKQSKDSSDFLKKSKENSFMDSLKLQLTTNNQKQKQQSVKKADISNEKASSKSDKFFKDSKNNQSLQTLKNSIAVLQNTLKTNQNRQKHVPDEEEKNNESFLEVIKDQLKKVKRLQKAKLSSSESDGEQKQMINKTPNSQLTSSLKKRSNRNYKKKQKVRFKPLSNNGSESESIIQVRDF